MFTPNQWARYTAKKCKACGTVTSVLARVDGGSVKIPANPGRFGGWWQTMETDPAGAWVLYSNGVAYLPCRGCCVIRMAHRVLGKFNPGKRCAVKCESATGHACECSCGGKNHGAAHG